MKSFWAAIILTLLIVAGSELLGDRVPAWGSALLFWVILHNLDFEDHSTDQYRRSNDN